MAKLYFRYSAMNAGKSTSLLQVAYNYEERDGKVAILTSDIDNRNGIGKVTSRLGVSRDAIPVNLTETIHEVLIKHNVDISALKCILIDETQFFSEDQITELHKIAHCENVPVICYGLRADFKGNLFTGSAKLLAIADSLEELKTICRCGRKATMNARVDENGNIIREGDQVLIGDNSKYESVCPTKFYTGSCD